MRLYMYYIENGMLERYEREAAVVINNLGEKWYRLTEQFPFWNADKIFHMACNKVLSGDRNHRDKLFVLSESEDFTAAIDIFQEYDQKKIEEYQGNIQRLEKEKASLESEIKSLDIQKNRITHEEKVMTILGEKTLAEYKAALYFLGDVANVEILTKTILTTCGEMPITEYQEIVATQEVYGDYWDVKPKCKTILTNHGEMEIEKYNRILRIAASHGLLHCA